MQINGEFSFLITTGCDSVILFVVDNSKYPEMKQSALWNLQSIEKIRNETIGYENNTSIKWDLDMAKKISKTPRQNTSISQQNISKELERIAIPVIGKGELSKLQLHANRARRRHQLCDGGRQSVCLAAIGLGRQRESGHDPLHRSAVSLFRRLRAG